MKTLQFQSKTRPGASNKHERHYLDFVISGLSLREILGINGCDLISPFGWGDNKEYERDLIKVLTLRRKSDLATERVMLYVCPECGDIDCGAITANVVDQGDRIVWKDFGYETGYGGVTENYDIEPIEFERQNYFKAFSLFK
ncbi:MAG TPA: hypothetical protein VFO70_03730 [Chitinophagaceae bacterium]|nr:hypothetical protein [Chitinophagaceae bacterium]